MLGTFRARRGGARSRPIDELSGGRRQRAWIAMTLAQDTELVQPCPVSGTPRP